MQDIRKILADVKDTGKKKKNKKRQQSILEKEILRIM